MATGEQNNPEPEHDGRGRKTGNSQMRERLAFGIALVALWSLGLLIVLTQ